MNELCSYCGFTVDPSCGTCGAPAHPWYPACRAGATRAAIDDAVARSKAEREANDPVHHPRHYTQGAVECIDAIQSALGADGLVTYCRGAALKYLWRMDRKGKPVEDLRKAVWYLNKAIALLEDA